MTAILVVTVAVAVLFALDRVALWAEARGWIYWRRTSRPTGTAVGAVMGELLEVFQPTRHAIVAESERKRLDIQHPESGDSPRGVDLQAGKVTLHRD